MKKLFLILAIGIFFQTGCNEQSNQGKNIVYSPASNTLQVVNTAPMQANTFSPDTESNKTRLSPLEKAQNEYLKAYDEYVRSLRESGPQTLETLQALADYQKKYQLYQMILRAEKKAESSR
ncbi:MAG: hypothetical protein Kow0029_10930 [Candidatus Rifleibacteriota bacterium]